MESKRTINLKKYNEKNKEEKENTITIIIIGSIFSIYYLMCCYDIFKNSTTGAVAITFIGFFIFYIIYNFKK